MLKKYLKKRKKKISFKGKTVLITGGTSGLGEHLTERLLALEATKIIVTGKDKQKLKKIERLPYIHTLLLDYSHPEEVE